MHAQLLGLVVTLLAGSDAVAPDTSRILHAHRTDSPPVIDGRLDDAVWQRFTCIADTRNGNGNGNGTGAGNGNGDLHVSRAAEDAVCAGVGGGFVQRAPHPGRPAVQQSEVMVAIDDRSMYVAVRMHDSAPDSIVARLARRDDAVHSDWVHVHVGSVDDGRTGFVFSVNPRGVKRDVLISEDGRRDVSWNAVWHAAAAVDEHGWTAEFRIPLSQLRYRAGQASWGLNVERQVARTGEVSHWAPTPPDASGVVSQYGRLTGLEHVPAARRLELQPYVLSSVTAADVAPGDPYRGRTTMYQSMGGDVRYGIGSALTLAATFNPDFGQVEGDPAVVNLTAFETFHPEQRPFFTEGSEIFRAAGPQLFYSRRIGRAPQLSPPASAVFAEPARSTTILGASKLTGRLPGGWTVGALAAVTDEERLRFTDADGNAGSSVVEPMTGYGVLRVRREFDRGRSGVGVLATGVQRRLGDDARLQSLTGAAFAATVDARWRIDDAHELSAAVSGSSVAGPETAIARVQRSATHRLHRTDAAHLRFDPDRTRLDGHAASVRIGRISGGPWRWTLGTNLIGPGFEIGDVGFNQRSDQIWSHASGAYERHTAGGRFNDWRLSTFMMREGTYGGEHLRSIVDVMAEATFRNHGTAETWVQREFGGVDVDALRGGPAIVRPSLWRVFAALSSDRRARAVLRGSAYAEQEDGTGTRTLNTNATLQLRPSRAFDTSIGVQLRGGTQGWQYVGRYGTDDDARYLFGALDQRSAALTVRTTYALSPDLTFQLHARPFSYGGRYRAFMESADPRAPRFDERFHRFADDALSYDAASDSYTALRDGAAPLHFDNPDIGTVSLNLTALLRWEYRPGSTLFVVWGSERADYGDARFPGVTRDFAALRNAPGSNSLMIKLSYWLGL